MAAAAPNVWSQMNYVPPRGQCNYRQSLISAKCPCLRFMLHPLKSSSSYECDGCAHHASFHSMENKAEDEVRKRWEQEAQEKTDRTETMQQRPKKRVRAIEYTARLNGGTLEDNTNEQGGASRSSNRRVGGGARGGRKTNTKTRSTTVESNEGVVIDLDEELD